MGQRRRSRARIRLYPSYYASPPSIRGVGSKGSYDAIILTVAHQQFRDMGAAAIRALGKPGEVLYDLKYVLPADQVDLRL